MELFCKDCGKRRGVIQLSTKAGKPELRCAVCCSSGLLDEERLQEKIVTDLQKAGREVLSVEIGEEVVATCKNRYGGKYIVGLNYNKRKWQVKTT